MRIVFGRFTRSVEVASACSAEVDPMPQASAPSAPCEQVWLSGQTRVAPGSTIPSSGEITCPMPCRSEEHTSELQSLMRISYAVFCLKKKKPNTLTYQH